MHKERDSNDLHLSGGLAGTLASTRVAHEGTREALLVSLPLDFIPYSRERKDYSS